jgi:hypothetical protein
MGKGPHIQKVSATVNDRHVDMEIICESGSLLELMCMPLGEKYEVISIERGKRGTQIRGDVNGEYIVKMLNTMVSWKKINSDEEETTPCYEFVCDRYPDYRTAIRGMVSYATCEAPIKPKLQRYERYLPQSHYKTI